MSIPDNQRLRQVASGAWQSTLTAQATATSRWPVPRSVTTSPCCNPLPRGCTSNETQTTSSEGSNRRKLPPSGCFCNWNPKNTRGRSPTSAPAVRCLGNQLRNSEAEGGVIEATPLRRIVKLVGHVWRNKVVFHRCVNVSPSTVLN